MSDTLILPGNGKRDPVAILESARNVEFDQVMVIGWQEDGSFFISHSESSAKEVVWLLDNALDWAWRERCRE